MANQILIKRGTGTSALANGELGYNTSTNTLYIGNNGNKAIGGSGAFLPLSGGTMTGPLTTTQLTVNRSDNDYPTVNFIPKSRNPQISSFIQTNIDGKFGFYSYHSDQDTDDDTGRYYTGYTLPGPITGLNAENVTNGKGIIYEILTAKKAVTVAQGGTGQDMSETPANALIRMSSAGTFWYTASAKGAVYAESANGAIKFGTLPIAEGGTGSTTAAGARTALGITPANIGALPTTVQSSGYDATSGSNTTSAYFIYRKNNTTVNKMDLWADHTSFTKPVNIASGGTGGTSVITAATNLFANNSSINQVVRLAGTMQTVKQLFTDVTANISVSDYFVKLNNLNILNTMLSFTHVNSDTDAGLSDMPDTAGMGIALNGWSGWYPYHKILFFGKNRGLYYWSSSGSTTDENSSVNGYTGQWYSILDDTTGVKKSGDTMTGCLWANGGFAVKGNYDINILSGTKRSYVLKTEDGNTTVGGMSIDPTTNEVSFIQKMVNQNYYETYYLPAPASTAANKEYTILTTKNTITVAQGGTGATSASGACINLGAVKKSGDTMTGQLTTIRMVVSAEWPTYAFYHTTSNKEYAFIQTGSDASYGFYSYGANESKWTGYVLPGPDTELTNNKKYHILTTKNTITIAQGGTGATNMLGAQANLLTTDSSKITATTDLNTILQTGRFKMEGNASTTYNWPANASEARCLVIQEGALNNGTYGYWKQTTHMLGQNRTYSRNYHWDHWMAWNMDYNEETLVYSASQPINGYKGRIWLKPI